MASNFSALTRVIYSGLKPVSRELVGFIPSVDLDASAAIAAKGQTISVPSTVSATLADFTPAATTPEGTSITPGTVDMTIAKSKKAGFVATGEQERALNNSLGNVEEWYAGQFAESMRVVTNDMEADIAALYDEASSAYGTAAVTPFASTLTDLAQVRRELMDRGAPQAGLQCVIDTAAGASFRSLATLNQANTAGTDSLQRQGVLLDLFGFAVRESGQVKLHTAGTGTGDTFAAEAAGQTVLSTTTIATGNYLEGDVIQVGTGGRKYVVSTSDVSGKTVTINGDKGVLSAIPTGRALLRSASYRGNLAFHRSAIKLVARIPDIPEAANITRQIVVDPISGLPFLVLRVVQYGQVTYEVHMAWGVQAIKPDWMCVLQG
jgi:hypothetical protein